MGVNYPGKLADVIYRWHRKRAFVKLVRPKCISVKICHRITHSDLYLEWLRLALRVDGLDLDPVLLVRRQSGQCELRALSPAST